NIHPPQIVDLLASMFDQFEMSIDNFIAKGCVPPNFVIGAGDSVFFQADYKFTNNFVPLGSNAPPLINFRSSICDLDKGYAWKLEDYCSEKPLSQFSGYLESVNPAAQVIEPCAQSTEKSPFRYNMRIARANMFPFEVRQLSEVTHYAYSLPAAVALLETKLNYLRLQDNVQLFGVTPLTPGYAGDSLSLNLNPFFANLLDEGYSFEISTRFDTTCGYDGTRFGRTVLGLEYANMCFHDPVLDTYYIVNPNGYLSGSPEFEIFTQNNILYLPTDVVQFDFQLRNNSEVDASNAWLSIESDGDLADVQLLYMPGQTPVPQVGGVYQFGNLTSFADVYLRINARNLSCRPVTVTFRFGWDCSPVFNANADACGSFTKTIELRPQPPELELVIVNQPPAIPMCAPSGYFEFEISNANDGTAYNIVPSIKLPPGVRIQPGSSQLSYPAGGAFVNLTDPVQLPGNVWQFDPEASSNILAQNGLLSADQDPLNALRIRFRVIAECGVVANAQPIYGAESVQACGINSNILRKPGMPLGIEGVEPTTTAVSNLQFSNPPGAAGCGQEIELSASIAVNDVPMTGDSIYILLPVGTTFVNGSYQAGTNAPAGPPQVFGQQLQLPLPTNLVAGSVLGFTIKVRYDDPAGCADKFVILQTREKTEAFCASSNQFCDIYIATSEALLNLNAQNPELQINNFELTTQGGQTNFNAVLENAGATTAINPVVQLYHDQNGNGQIDLSDPLVAEITPNGAIVPGGLLPISGNLNNLPASAFCDLIALIPADENCACADHIFPLDGNQIVTTGIGLCDLQSVNVSADSIAGNTYTWLTPAGLSCIPCANATYTPGPDVQAGDLVTLILQEKSGDCTIERKFEIQFGGMFGIESDSMRICEGDPAMLEATAGGTSYNWTGPGITSPNQQTQIVQPSDNAIYSVTVTFAGGCTGTGTVSVVVNPAFNMQLPTITICEGESATILGQTTNVPGIYTLELVKLNGCDSIISQELRVIPNKTLGSPALFCPGDSVSVFGVYVSAPGEVCKTFQSSTGCDSTHCVQVSQATNPQLPEQDSALVVALGEGVVIETPNGYDTYEWIPFDPEVLSCNCPDPVASPDTSTTFILVVTDGNGCRDSAEYRVFVCDKSLIHIPNAFTPNGDGANDVFRVAPHEGAEVILLLRVFDRWGQKLYEGSGPNAQWDGKIGDKLAPSDVYVWVLEYECGGESHRESSDVTLLR
ncbi:MAG: gliding motility-associated C-terminal domain-containing protein, partial [Saprospiraceae bacterium]|nr:gliding motility-associated C-terminal domain-containing protein [Saprospiraceae bacterium]